MRIGIAINARLGSTRLPNKHLADIHGKPALYYLIKRLPKENIWIATGNKEENYKLECLGIPVFYGDYYNVPRRHYQLAKTKSLDAIVSIDGDDLFTSQFALGRVIAMLKAGSDLVRTQGLPYGMNVLWAYRVTKLKEAINKNSAKINDTGWGWIFDGFQIAYCNFDDRYKDLRMTLDTPEDLEFFRHILKNCPTETQLDDEKLSQWVIANSPKK